MTKATIKKNWLTDYGGGPSWCQMGNQWLPTDRSTKPLRVVMVLPPCLMYFWLPRTLGTEIRLQYGLLTYPCGVLSMWAYVLWAFVLVGFCPDTDREYLRNGWRYPKSADVTNYGNSSCVWWEKSGELWSTNGLEFHVSLNPLKCTFFGRLYFSP